MQGIAGRGKHQQSNLAITTPRQHSPCYSLVAGFGMVVLRVSAGLMEKTDCSSYG